jgi:hypothetical protein
MIRPGLILLLCLMIRVAYAVYVQTGGIENTVEGDALVFFEDIVFMVQSGQFFPFEIGRNPYINSAGVFSFVFGNSPFAVCLFSVFCFVLAAFILVKICEDLELGNSRTLLVSTVFCFTPTAIIYTSIPLREAMQVLGINLMMFGLVRSMMRGSVLYVAVAIAGAFVASVTHGSLAMSSACIVGLFVALYGQFQRGHFSVVTLVRNIAIISFPLISFQAIFSLIAYDISGGVLEAITNYQEGGLSETSRAGYRTEALGTSIAASLVGIPVGFFQYLFEPFPGRSFVLVDLVLTAENAIRLLLIVMAIRGLLRERRERARIMIFFLLSAYVLIELVWSLGTLNWGTASRHHVPAMAVLLLAALFYRPDLVSNAASPDPSPV